MNVAMCMPERLRRTRVLLSTVSIVLLGGCGTIPGGSVPSPDSYTRLDYLLTGGTVFDGSGDPPYPADVGIRGGRVAFVGDVRGTSLVAEDTVDVTGLWVTPGFIDMHSHPQLHTDYGKSAEASLYQGITTVVVGIDGQGEPDIAELLAGWTQRGIGVNGIPYVGHGAIRQQVMGTEARAPTADELSKMKALVQRAMEEGAWGLSTGLFYVPGTYATTEEVIELGKVAARFDGAIYDTHDRDLGAVYQGVGYDASVQETIRITEETGLRGIFSHYNLQGRHNRGRGEVAARYIDEARQRGVDIWAAQHPYLVTLSMLSAYTLPSWAAAGGPEAIRARFDDPETSARIAKETGAMLDLRGGADKLVLASLSGNPDIDGKTLAAVAAKLGLSPALAVQEILRSGEPVGAMNLDLYDDENTRRLAREPWMMTCTDGFVPPPNQKYAHPRAYGAFPKKLREYALDDTLLSPEFAIRSFSGLAADFLRLPDRGYLRKGQAADVVVLDPKTYRDKASYVEPRQTATGVVHLLVNGQFAIRDTALTDALAGQALPRGAGSR